MAAHIVLPLQKQQKQEHELHEQLHAAGAWAAAGGAPPLVAGAGCWPMAWSRSHGVAAAGGGGARTSATAAAAAAGEDSWEVRAFAEDAASCSEQWPPRSYSCSFCAREFRTAQALGGHMNVHRRERAYANQLGLLRSAPNSPGAADASSCSASATPSSTPALGLCWLYPVPSHSANSNSLSCHQVSSSTVTTATPLASSMSRQSDTKRGFGEGASIDRKKMMLDHDPNIDLELRLGQAL